MKVAPTDKNGGGVPILINSVFNYHKADDKIFVCKFSKKMLSPSYIILRIQRLEGKHGRSILGGYAV